MKSLTILQFLNIALFLLALGCHHTTEPPSSVDTTSHAILWRSDMVAFGGFSVVHDVAIIAEDNVWAAGEYHLRDSTGEVDPALYNVMRWDGVKWNALRFTFVYGGSTFIRPAYAVFAFGPTDIWLAAEAPRRCDGSKLINVDLGGAFSDGQTYRFWGTSSSNLYAVGFNGTMARFDGTHFTKIATGVQSLFNDIAGRGDYEIYVSSYYYDNQIRPSGVFAYSNGRFQFLGPQATDSSLFQAQRDAFGVWVSPQGTLWATGWQFIFRPLFSHAPFFDNDGWVLTCLRGTADNDVWAGGDQGGVLHFNGASWHAYTSAELHTIGLERIRYNAVAVKGSTVVLGGTCLHGTGAILTLGKRISSN
jgi:hypothetical protein